jgi:hypothetical protein
MFGSDVALNTGWVLRGTYLVAASLGPPAVISASANLTTTTLSFNDFLGYKDIAIIDLLLSFYLDAKSACYIAFVPSIAPAGTLYLVNDAGDAGGQYAGSVAFDSLGNGHGSASNSQCTVQGSQSSIQGNGTVLTLSLNVTYTASFGASSSGGTKVLWTSVGDSQSINSGWQPAGVVTIPGAATSNPSVKSTVPSSGGGLSGTFTFAFTDTKGWTTGLVDVLVNNYLTGVSACYFAFVPSGTHPLYLLDDAGDNGHYLGNVAFDALGRGSGSATNSQCTINGVGSSFSISGSLLTLTLNISFTPSFGGDRIFYEGSVDGASSGWMAMASWMVGGSSP